MRTSLGYRLTKFFTMHTTLNTMTPVRAHLDSCMTAVLDCTPPKRLIIKLK